MNFSYQDRLNTLAEMRAMQPFAGAGRGEWFRLFTSADVRVGLRSVITVHGFQYSGNRRCERWISVRSAEAMTPAQTRELAAALVLTADQLDTL